MQHGGTKEGRHCLEELISIFGKTNVYVELQRHFHREQEVRNQAAIALARELHLPLLATNGVCYATVAEREIADVFTCIKYGEKLHTAGVCVEERWEGVVIVVAGNWTGARLLPSGEQAHSPDCARHAGRGRLRA